MEASRQYKYHIASRKSIGEVDSHTTHLAKISLYSPSQLQTGYFFFLNPPNPYEYLSIKYTHEHPYPIKSPSPPTLPQTLKLSPSFKAESPHSQTPKDIFLVKLC